MGVLLGRTRGLPPRIAAAGGGLLFGISLFWMLPEMVQHSGWLGGIDRFILGHRRIVVYRSFSLPLPPVVLTITITPTVPRPRFMALQRPCSLQPAFTSLVHAQHAILYQAVGPESLLRSASLCTRSQRAWLSADHPRVNEFDMARILCLCGCRVSYVSGSVD